MSYAIYGTFPGYLPEHVETADDLSTALDLFSDTCLKQANHLDYIREVCEDEDHYGATEDGEECEECLEMDAYAELLQSTHDNLFNLSDDLPNQVKIMGDNEQTEYIRNNGISIHVPNGTTFPWVINMIPNDEE